MKRRQSITLVARPGRDSDPSKLQPIGISRRPVAFERAKSRELCYVANEH